MLSLFNLSINAIPLNWDGKFDCFKFRAIKFAMCNFHRNENYFDIEMISQVLKYFHANLFKFIEMLSQDNENSTLRKISVQ